jgi:glutamate-1-semialdehyde 2,1-aminomutase
MTNSPQAAGNTTLREFKVRMLNHGIYVMHGGGGISTAHSEEDINRIIKAAEEVAREMKAS